MLSDHIGTLQIKEMIVNGYATAEITKEQLTQWADNLTYVSYYTYGFNLDGSLAPINDGNLIRYAYGSGTAPFMVLTPLNTSGVYSYELVGEVITDPLVRSRLIDNVLLTAAEKKYYGLVFNFGPIAVEDREEFVITVAKTAARLNPRGVLVIVSLTPGANDAGIDYVSLGKAANFTELRTFQWEQSQMPPAAISPFDKTSEMLTRITSMIERGTILLGLPNFGYDWTLPYIQGKTAAEMISNTEAADRAKRTGAKVQYDDVVQSPYYFYNDSAGAKHIVWYDDERSFGAKLELVNDFDLAGISIWTIMNPFPAGIKAMNGMFEIFKVRAPA